MTNRVAISLASSDTDQALALLAELAPRVGYAELRLDLMGSYDLPRLIRDAPCPLIITCRPTREGGRFSGTEPERLAILQQAAQLGCAYIDVEWDCVADLRAWERTETRILVSRHWYDHMPADLWSHYLALRQHADAVKLVGMARQLADLGPVFEVLRRAHGPVIAIAMGQIGVLSRLLAPCFAACLLTYAAVTEHAATAPGQISLREMTEVYQLQSAGPHTHICLHFCVDTTRAAAAIARNDRNAPATHLHVPLVIAPDQLAAVVPALIALPQMHLTADPELRPALDRALIQ